MKVKVDNLQIPSQIRQLSFPQLEEKNITLFIKRDDLIHPQISGNKWRKIKKNIDHYFTNEHEGILTFGGAYSNHMDAMAFIGHQLDIPVVGIIRGEEPVTYNATLNRCMKMGMQLHFVSRSEYRLKDNPDYLAQLKQNYPNYYILPEGGANELGIQGCEAIVDEIEMDFDYITVDCGTGATLAGIARRLKSHQKALGISVLKGGSFLKDEVIKWNGEWNKNVSLITDYHFGGYAKHTNELISFMQQFYQETGVKTDPIYTGKQFYAVLDLIKKNYFLPQSNILMIHTGGLQGNEGFENRFGLQLFPEIPQ